jgi:N-succinyldiaminopimelate aminotransferase
VILDAAAAALHEGHNQYAPLPGVPALREAVAAHQRRHYGLEPDPVAEVQVTFGATEGLAAALLALVGPATRCWRSIRPMTPTRRSCGWRAG